MTGEKKALPEGFLEGGFAAWPQEVLLPQFSGNGDSGTLFEADRLCFAY